MTRQCFFCLGYNSKKRKVQANLVFNLEKKILGIDQPYASKGICEKCLNHWLEHFPPSSKPTLYKFPLRVSYFEHGEMKEGVKPFWFLSKPIKFFLASGSRPNGSFAFGFEWYRKVFGLSKSERVGIPASVRKQLPNQCEVCGGSQNLVTRHKIPLSLGGSNEKENLEVLCKVCYEKSGMYIPYPLDLTQMLKKTLEKEYGSKILFYEMKH